MSIMVLLYLAEILVFFLVNYIVTIKGCNNFQLYNNLDKSAEINVTAWSKLLKIHYRIIDVDVTWFQAFDICKTMKYGRLSSALPRWALRINVRKYLEGINYKNLNYSFWVRAFRPRLHVRQWYSNIKSCAKYNFLDNVEDHDKGLCAAIKRNESDFLNESVFVDDCNLKHPFVCTRDFGCVDILVYPGFDALGTPTGASVSHLSNVSIDNCKTKCINDSVCNSFTYANLSQSCTLFKRTYGYGALNYTIYISSTSDVTHYIKMGSIIELVSNASNISIPDNEDLPDCGTEEFPQEYCPCSVNTEENISSIDDIATEIVKNLTIEKRTTSAYRRKVSCSADDRNVSKALGSLGVIVIITTLSLFVLSDVSNYLTRKACKC